MVTHVLIPTTNGQEFDVFAFYQDSNSPLPPEGIVVLSARSFGPDKYLVLNLNQKKALIFSPYKATGLLHIHQMTEEEYERTMTLLTSEQVENIPPRSDKAAFDAFEFRGDWKVGHRTMTFQHILPDNKAVLALYELYKHFLETEPRQ